MSVKPPASETDRECARLYDLCLAWSRRFRPPRFELSSLAGLALPKARYVATRAYNGFSPAERERKSRLVRLLRKEGLIAAPSACDLCGATKRIGFHSENYYDAFSLLPVCFPCHMAIHRRIWSWRHWEARLESYPDSAIRSQLCKLAKREPDLAAWLRRKPAAITPSTSAK